MVMQQTNEQTNKPTTITDVDKRDDLKVCLIE